MRHVDAILNLLERIGRLIQSDGYANGLVPTQWEALRYFARANRFSRSPSALTAYLGSTKGTVSQTITALERKGLIEKREEPRNRRQVRIELTPAGRSALKRDPLEALSASLARIPAKQRKAMEADLRDLLTETLDERQGRPFGVCRTCRYFQRRSPDGAPHRCGLLEVPLSAADSELICVEHA